MDDKERRLSTITGRYCYVANPCTINPCLPGMAYAIFADGLYYYITVNGRWSSANRSWDDYEPQSNDSVAVTGHVRERKDAFGKLFYALEAVSLRRNK